MATLPRPPRPEYSTTIPSTGRKIKFVPFTVKEEKVLVLASESKDPEEIANALENILHHCVTSPSDFAVKDLALFDIEYLFLKTRAKSAGEVINVRVQDPKDPEYSVEHSIHIDKIQVYKNPKHKNPVQISDEISVKMKYPGMDFFIRGLDMSSITKQLDVITECISQIIHGEDVYNASEMEPGELESWLEDLQEEHFEKIVEFFNTLPKLQHKIKLKNENTGEPFEVTLEGLGSFFTSE